MNKPVVFLKSHVDAFTRRDGVVVQAHDTKVQARTAPDVKTRNEGMGFHGAALNSHRQETHGVDGDARSEAEHRDQYRAADHAFSNAAHALVGAGHFANHEQARDFLDSTHGRHLGDEVGHKGDATKPKWLGRSVKTFKKDNDIVDSPGAAPAAASASPGERQRRGSAPIQQKGAPPVEGVAQPSPAEKVAAGRKKIADRAVVQKAGDDIGAGSWSKGHKVKIHAPGHHLHAKAGEITGPDTESPGRVVVKHEDGTAHSVHGSDLRPALGHSWPQ